MVVNMAQYVARRFLQLPLVLFVVSLVVFSMLRIIPGDPARIIAGEDTSMETIEAIRVELGLDKPLPVQYLKLFKDALRGDLGLSLRTRNPVAQEIVTRFPVTMKLAVCGTALSMVLGVLAGIISAARQYSAVDAVAMVVALIGVSAPSFWLGLILLLVFSLWLKMLPAVGASTLLHYVLPSVTLGARGAGIIARQTRSAMLDVIRQDFIRTARAKGLPERAVIYRHALKNALIPVITVIGLQFGVLLAGSVIVEKVFTMPGLGRVMVDSIAYRDYPMVQGSVLVVAVSFVVVNLLVDVMYAAVDPRIHYG